MSESDDLLRKATETLSSAEILFEADRSTDCVSRAYYAMYQATQALLLAYGFESSSHKGARMLFGKHFVKTGKIDQRYATSLREAYDARLLADYSGEVVTNKQARQILIGCASLRHRNGASACRKGRGMSRNGELGRW